MPKIKTFCADFETTSEYQYKIEGKTRVYLWRMSSLDEQDISMNISMDTFFDKINTLKTSNIYFHNLSFDGEFIIWYLLENEYKYVECASKQKEFETIIDNCGSIFQIKIINENNCPITFKCSYKLFPKSIKSIGEMVGIPKLNETHNYEEIKNFKSIDEVNDEEIKYITNDVKIMVALINYLSNVGIKGLTMSSSAYKDWRKEKYTLSKFQMNKNPNEEIVDIVRKSYRGGITKVNPKYANVELNDVISFDVNSLYPSVMYENNMPIGDGVFYKNERECLKNHRPIILYVILVKQAKVRDGKHAFIGEQSGFTYSRKYTYSDTITNKYIYLWGCEYNLFKLIYEGEWIVEKVIGWKSSKNVFKNYIDRWYKVKENAKTPAERSLAKLMLNSLYGKFGMNDCRASKMPVSIDDEDIIYSTGTKMVVYYYVEIASYITALARTKLATFMNLCDDKFVYCDTDSVYYIGHSIPEHFKSVVDDKKLGYWKYEGHYTRFKSLKAKCYIKQLDNGDIIRRIAGCPEECGKLVNFDNFDQGLKLKGAKHLKRKVRGGIVIGTTDFTINVC